MRPRATWTCILLGLLWFGSVCAADSPAPAEDLERLRSQVRELERRVQKDVARQGRLQQDLRDSERSAAAARAELARVRRKLADTRTELAELRGDVEARQAELVHQRALLAAHVRYAYMTGRAEGLQVALAQDDPAQLGRRVTWAGYLARDRGRVLEAVQASLRTLEQSLSAVADRETELAGLEKSQSAQVAAIEKARQERAAVVSRLSAGVKSRSAELARARREARELERVVRELQRALSRVRPAEPPSEGKPLGPGRWPVPGRLLADFGQPRAGGQMHWDGVLIGAPAGTEVRAARAGRVVYADWLPGMGLLAIIDHGRGYLSLYGHNQDLTRRVGERVAAGDVIAHVGDTGGQSRPALYFELRRNGRPQNPRPWVR